MGDSPCFPQVLLVTTRLPLVTRYSTVSPLPPLSSLSSLTSQDQN